MGTVSRLDHEFCMLSMTNDRVWDCGATALVAIVVGDTLAVAGLGDSNGVLCCVTPCDTDIKEDGWKILEKIEDKKINGEHVPGTFNLQWKAVVNPHSPSRDDERKRIEDANGWVETDPENISRICGDLSVSRALGDREFKAAYNLPESGSFSEFSTRDDIVSSKWSSEHLREDYRLFPEPSKDHQFIGDVISSIPEINSFNLSKRNSDEFLLLACDGLWDVMSTIEATRLIRDLLFKRGLSAKESAEHLVERAFKLGSRDNVTVILVRFYRNGTNT